MEPTESGISPETEFWTICQKNGLRLGEAQVEKLKNYHSLLLGWNKKINLVSRKDEGNLWRAHFLHSAAILLQRRLAPGSSILDVGTGGGLPGIVLKILQPDLRLVLLDATKKKTIAVQEMVGELELADVETVWGRVEDLAESSLASRFEFVVARGVGSLQDLTKWAAGCLKKGAAKGQLLKNQYLRPPALIALKGGNLEREIAMKQQPPSVRRVTCEPVMFEGSERIGGIEKKLVTVFF